MQIISIVIEKICGMPAKKQKHCTSTKIHNIFDPLDHQPVTYKICQNVPTTIITARVTFANSQVFFFSILFFSMLSKIYQTIPKGHNTVQVPFSWIINPSKYHISNFYTSCFPLRNSTKLVSFCHGSLFFLFMFCKESVKEEKNELEKVLELFEKG